MKRLANVLIHGRSLRHRPVALPMHDRPPVRVSLRTASGVEDMTDALVPLSLKPFVFGVYLPDHRPPPVQLQAPCCLEFVDQESSTVIGRLKAVAVLRDRGADGDIVQLRPEGSTNSAVSPAARAWRYALAWRHVRANAKNPHHFRMSFSDLRALDVFYILPRPVYLVSVVHGERSNLFPMDLVWPVGEGRFLLALRRTNPSTLLMRESGRIVISSVPAGYKAVAYQLGSHHRLESIDWDKLPFDTIPSHTFGVPTPSFSMRTRELEVRWVTDVGSHMCFETRVRTDVLRTAGMQLCHVSDMYAHWRAAQGRAFEDA